MYGVALRILHDRDDASDAVQNAVAKMWLKRDSVVLNGNPGMFCCRVISNVCIDMLRQRVPKVKDYELEMQTSHFTADGLSEYNSAKEHLTRLLSGFSPGHRRVLWLSLVCGLDYREIVEATGESPGNVRQIISRGRQKLRQQYEKR